MQLCELPPQHLPIAARVLLVQELQELVRGDFAAVAQLLLACDVDKAFPHGQIVLAQANAGVRDGGVFHAGQHLALEVGAFAALDGGKERRP